MKKTKKEVIIAMDLNLDLLKSSSDSHTQLFLENNITNCIYPCITKPTCVTHSMATLIDNIWCNEKLHRNNCSYVYDVCMYVCMYDVYVVMLWMILVITISA